MPQVCSRAVENRTHRVPGVVVHVDGPDLIAPHPGGIHLEPERRAVVVIAVDQDREPVGVARIHVAPAEARGDPARVVEPCPDIEEIVVVEDAHLAALGRRLPFGGVDLGEGVGDGGTRPILLVEPAVDPHLPLGVCGLGDGDRAGVGRAAGLRGENGRREPRRRGKEDSESHGSISGESDGTGIRDPPATGGRRARLLNSASAATTGCRPRRFATLAWPRRRRPPHRLGSREAPFGRKPRDDTAAARRRAAPAPRLRHRRGAPRRDRGPSSALHSPRSLTFATRGRSHP